MRAREGLWIQLGAAALIGCASLSIRFSLDPLLGAMQPFSPGFIAIAVTVWFFGWRGALLVAAMNYLGANYFFIEPRGAWSFGRPADAASMLTYMTSAGLIIWFGHLAQRYIREARQAGEQKDAFVAMVAHELRGPIGAATNAVMLMKSPQTTSAMKEAAVEITARQLSMMNVLIRDLLDLGRINRRQLALQKTSIELRDCIDDVVASVQSLSHAKQQKIVVDAPASVRVYADRSRLVQILFNLLDNACKYSSESAVIEVRVKTGDSVIIEIADDGEGIPPDLLPHVFDLERPADLHHRSRSGGLGLGLPLAKHLAELHGGQLVAGKCSSLGGACLTMSLPPQPNVA